MLKVGLIEQPLHTRFSPTALVSASYLTAISTGVDSFWLPDHINSLFPPAVMTSKHVGTARLAPNADAHYDPWTMLGYLAARHRWRRRRLGIGVTDPGRRNPAVTAQAAATVHLLTRGRAILGFGTGARTSNEPYGVDWAKPVARFEEAIATIRALWNSGGELVTRDSPFFPLHKAAFELPPYRGKWPEIWIGARGPRMLRAAGRYADGWFPAAMMFGPKDYALGLDAVRAAASDAGRDPLSITPAGIRFILTGRAPDEIDEILDSNLVKLFVLNSSAADWERHGAQHPMGPEFKGVQDLIPQLIDEETALKYAAMAPRGLVKELFAVGMPDEVVDQLAMFRDSCMQCLVVGNMGALHPKLSRSAAAMMPYLKVLRRLKKL